MSRARRRGVSLDYHVAADTWASLRHFDGETQEAILDEIEELCESGELAARAGEVIHEGYVRGPDGMLHVTLYLLVNQRVGLITVMGLE